ncbi:MAG: SpoIID/LytB domain-containing protein [Deltaproteobacteria bacterium]|nr:SpoIID/LytB domain-containing protein [Deltaproteobacteria bacterium]MCL5278141.1 SpoIID/LytB domain-containing protein [Deltaproteobacteria bacterium]
MFKNMGWVKRIPVRTCALVVAVLLAPYTASGGPIPRIRVEVFSDAPTLHIEGRGIQLIDTYRNLYLFKNPGDSYIVMSAGNNGMMVNEKLYAARIVTLLFSGGVVKINDRLLRGHLEIANIDDSHLVVINEVDLESYVAGLINAEMPHDWPLEALEAQAVVARTYALWQKGRHLNQYYDMDAGFMDQVYSGAGSEDTRGWDAVNATRGQIITYGGKPILAMYHSICGGETENSEDAIGYRYPYLRSVKCNFCRIAPGFRWKYAMSFRRLARELIAKGYHLSAVSGFKVLKRSRTHRVTIARIVTDRGNIDLDGAALRAVIGYDKLRSTLFWVNGKDGTLLFSGRGFGHGVGMCQWGAYGMAKKGYTYKQIIHYYYKGVRIERMY